jgi:hypothetical protein
MPLWVGALALSMLVHLALVAGFRLWPPGSPNLNAPISFAPPVEFFIPFEIGQTTGEPAEAPASPPAIPAEMPPSETFDPTPDVDAVLPPAVTLPAIAPPCPPGTLRGRRPEGAKEAPCRLVPAQPRLRLPGGTRLDENGDLVPDDMRIIPGPAPEDVTATRRAADRELMAPLARPSPPSQSRWEAGPMDHQPSAVVPPVIPKERPPVMDALRGWRP